jgi:hypothetical protein
MAIKIPESVSAGLNDDRIEIGSVFYQLVSDISEVKRKYFVVVGFTQDKLALGNVYINTLINPNKFPTPELKALHLEVTVSDCPFLSHSSYIDCSDVYSKDVLALKETMQRYSESPFVGCIPEALMQRVLLTLKVTDTIPDKKKRKYGLL